MDAEGRNETAPRTRDADLGAFDRVRLRLDVDRDYATAYELTVDRRGWPGDRCWEDAAWNPRWFIAAKQTPKRSTQHDSADGAASWSIEAALPWSELTDAAPRRGAAWTLGVERLAPGAAGESATPSEFSLLLFE